MRHAVWGLTLLGAVLLLAGAWTQARAEDWEVTAKSFVIMDANTGKILFAHNPQAMLPPASTLKVMTAMLVTERLKMDDRVNVSAYASQAPPSKLGIKPGEVYTVKDLLYALLLGSANDGARALAERVSGSEETFAHQLTQAVRAWGAYRTTLANANGLPADFQFSTAQDLAVLFRRAIQNPDLLRIMSTKYYTVQGDREVRNHNRFLFTTPMAIAGKTGFTKASRHTFVGLFKKDDTALIISLMGSQQKWADLRVLIHKGFELSGTPIAKMEPLEERVWFPKKAAARGGGKGKIKIKRTKAKVIVGNAASLPTKKKTKSR
jgi:D-alanyl-D-alanine carboxypeptidase (penicillin-binding protein 5/6)